MRQDRLLSELEYSGKVETSGAKQAVIEDVILDDGEPYVIARPIYNRQFINAGGEIENTEAALVYDVPVWYPSSQDFADWNPPKKGDTGLLVYMDQSFDVWWLEGLTAINTDNPRRKNRSDCFFLPGGWSKAKPMLEASPEWFERRNMENTRRVAMNGEQVHIQSGFWNLMVSDSGFDVKALGVSMMEEIIAGLSAAADGLDNLGQGSKARAINAAVTKLKVIKGSVVEPIRMPTTKERP